MRMLLAATVLVSALVGGGVVVGWQHAHGDNPPDRCRDERQQIDARFQQGKAEAADGPDRAHGVYTQRFALNLLQASSCYGPSEKAAARTAVEELDRLDQQRQSP